MLVAVEQAEQAYLVGFAASGPADDEALAPGEPAAALGTDVAAVTDLLVEPRWGRRGHGSRLLAAAVDRLARRRLHPRGGLGLRRRRGDPQVPHPAGWELDGAARALDVDDMLVPQVRLHVAVPAEPTDTP